jgi:hypothetical protein
MRKDSTSRKLRTLKLSRETLRVLSSRNLLAVAGGATWRCGETADCTDSCGANTCGVNCNDTWTCDQSRIC